MLTGFKCWRSLHVFLGREVSFGTATAHRREQNARSRFRPAFAVYKEGEMRDQEKRGEWNADGGDDVHWIKTHSPNPRFYPENGQTDGAVRPSSIIFQALKFVLEDLET